MLSLRKGGPGPGYVPAAFFLHFDEASRLGPGAVKKHLEYFRFTGMDFVKVQYERTFPPLPQIQTAADWKAMPRYGLDFYKPQLEVVDALVKAAGREALVLVTLYSPFMCAGHVGEPRAAREAHRRERRGRAPGARDDHGQPARLRARVPQPRRRRLLRLDPGRRGGHLPRPVAVREVRHALRPAPDARGRLELRLQHPPRLRLRGALRGPRAVRRLPRPRRQLQPAPDHRRAQPARAGAAVRPADHGRPGPEGSDRDRHERRDPARGARPCWTTAPERFVLGADCTVPGEGRWEGIRTAIAAAHAYRRG